MDESPESKRDEWMDFPQKIIMNGWIDGWIEWDGGRRGPFRPVHLRSEQNCFEEKQNKDKKAKRREETEGFRGTKNSFSESI